ncbi:DUF2188 domain-containing protein [Halomarina oriensis]|uniref:DUF2188 domain-containing protein n=1 Tax=Halomarina oriensis TaxID=671145 RepID=A0A6B0GEK1_9EURY|nr:DUF2188 domain-containing protein [Halomarina oriensis]MWG33144.1 hypothetical protein [Halomarina oriensis]
MDDVEIVVRFDDHRGDWTVRRSGTVVSRAPSQSEAFKEAAGLTFDERGPHITVRVIDRNGVAQDRLAEVA